MNMFNSNNFGRFIVDIKQINLKSPIVSKIMKEVIPVKILHHFDNHCLEYLAICDKFDKLKPTEKIPLYNFVFDGFDNLKEVIRLDYKTDNDEDVTNEILEVLNENKVNVEEFKAWASDSNVDTAILEIYNNDYLELLKFYVSL